jgi:oligopeptide transport system permease protein
MDQPSFPHKPPAVARGDERQQQYDRLLSEAASIRGVSLWQDAWKRLRRNWSAMLSLYFLIALGVLAFFTPLLPLQSPIKQNLRDASAENQAQVAGRQFQAPNWTPVSLELGKYRAKMSELTAKLEAASGEERKAIEDQIERYENDNPVREMAYHPGPLTKQMINARIAIFGDYCLPSLMGTDNLGRDVMARIFWGSRVSIIVALVAAFVSLVIGVTYGATSGYLGGVVDSLMMRFVDILYSIPFIFVVIFIITILSDEKVKPTLDKVGINQIIILYVLIGAIYWLTMARVVRGQVISLKTEQYIEAARTIGASTGRIVFRHLIPNVLGVVIVYLTLTIPAVMLFEAFLSFLGLGVTPPDVSWGILVNEGVQAITPIKVYWWLVLFPGLVFSLTLFALNFLGDGLRDALDPRLKNK